MKFDDNEADITKLIASQINRKTGKKETDQGHSEKKSSFSSLIKLPGILGKKKQGVEIVEDEVVIFNNDKTSDIEIEIISNEEINDHTKGDIEPEAQAAQPVEKQHDIKSKTQDIDLPSIKNINTKELAFYLVQQPNFLLNLGNTLKNDIAEEIRNYILERFHFIENQAYTKTVNTYNELMKQVKDVDLTLDARLKRLQETQTEIIKNEEIVSKQDNDISEKNNYIDGLNGAVERISNEVQEIGEVKRTLSVEIESLEVQKEQAQTEIVEVINSVSGKIIERQKKSALEIQESLSDTLQQLLDLSKSITPGATPEELEFIQEVAQKLKSKFKPNEASDDASEESNELTSF